MLEPSDRKLLFDSLQPPPGGQLDFAIGTTFTLDLFSLLTTPVAFAFSECQDSQGRPTADPLALLKGVRQYADRIHVFCQAGRIHVPSRYVSLLASLEESISEVAAPNKGGVFHPKVWVLRFNTEEGVLYRFLCMSRNISFDPCWDTILCLEGPLTDRKNAFSVNRPLGTFIEALPTLCNQKLAPVWRKRVTQAAAEIQRVAFEVPIPFDEIAFHPLGLPGVRSKPLPESCDKALVISPFVSNGLLQKICQSTSSAQLVSRSDELDKLNADTLAGFAAGAWMLADNAVPEVEDEVDSGSADQPTPNKLVSHLRGLHAKVYVVDQGWNASVLTGSANATSAAFESNVEFLTELRGKRSKCGVDAILGDSNQDPAKGNVSLTHMLERFVLSSGADEGEDDAAKQFEWQVAAIATQLSIGKPIVTCDQLDKPDNYSLSLSGDISAEITTSGCTFRVRPISMPNSRWFPVDFKQPVWCTVGPVSLVGITSFFVFEVTDPSGTMSKEFALNCQLVNPPENRRERLLREILSDPNRVLKFLLLLLGDGDPADVTGTGDGPGDSTREGSNANAHEQAALLELLLRTLSRSPALLSQVATLIEDLESSEEGKLLLPAGLTEVWQPIRSVWQDLSGKAKS